MNNYMSTEFPAGIDQSNPLVVQIRPLFLANASTKGGMFSGTCECYSIALSWRYYEAMQQMCLEATGSRFTNSVFVVTSEPASCMTLHSIWPNLKS